MGFDEQLANRIRTAFGERIKEIEEKRMFGGLSFLFRGKMTVGVLRDRIMARVPADKMEMAMNIPGTKPMDFTGKVMKEFVDVGPAGFETEELLQRWVEWGLEHANEKSRAK
jgi:TfoX/Sxy family transcriptional regulator of competence genes